jgi:N-acetylneuraminate epimerase
MNTLIKLTSVFLALAVSPICRTEVIEPETRMNTPAEPATVMTPENWRQLPSYPRTLGVAGIMAGQHQGMIIAAGGTNFPDAIPGHWGAKKSYDDIHVYNPKERAWTPEGKLPEARGYAAVVAMPEGILLLGGENAEKVFADSLWLKWDDGRVVVSAGPPLPLATTSPVAVAIERQIYLACGYVAGQPRLSLNSFWRLDLDDPEAGWVQLNEWPGPSRGQAVMAAFAGDVYLFSGLEVALDAEGSPKAAYLEDAYRYRPALGWEKIPDLPRSAIAAPTPAPVSVQSSRIFVLGGVDGRRAKTQPRDARVPDDILYFDVSAHAWKTWRQPWPDAVVTTPAVQLGREWVFVSGEITSGVRTPHVWAWNLE